jgi:hypothetical protein
MALVLAILGWVLLALLSLVLVLIVFPLEVAAWGRASDDELAAQARVAWAGGVVAASLSLECIEVRLMGWRVWQGPLSLLTGYEQREEKQQKKRKQKDRRHKTAAEGGRRWSLRHVRVLLRAGFRVLATLRVRLTVQGRLGLANPADTARVIQAVSTLDRLPGVSVALWPSYLDEELSGEVKLSARVWLLHTIGVALALLLQREVRKALFAMV